MINLRGADRKTFSQNGEDGIIEKILETIGTTNKYFVEIGVGNADECNTRILRENGWKGLMLDSVNYNPSIGVHREHVDAENVNGLLAKYHVPHEFDVLSIDIDGNDYWVWKAISYQPRVVIIEWNCSISPFRALSIPYSPAFAWDQTCYYGASILALKRLGERKGMALVAADKRATNLFFVPQQSAHLFKNAGQLELIYPDWHWSHPEGSAETGVSRGMSKTKLKPSAIVTIKDAGKMTDSARATLAEWLRKQAQFLLVHGPELAPTFRARYLYE